MDITYHKKNIETKENRIKIENTRDCYLCGRTETYNTSTLFGSFINEKGLVIIDIEHDCISYTTSTNTSEYTESYIKRYLERNNNVQIISKEQFKKEYNFILDKIKL